MSIAKMIEFKKKDIKDFQFLLRGLEPLSGYLKEVDSDIWKMVIACSNDDYDDEEPQIINYYKAVKVELYMDKILIYFTNIQRSNGYTHECDDYDDSEDNHDGTSMNIKKGIAIYDLLTGNLNDFFDKTFNNKNILYKLEKNLESVKH